MRHLWRSERRKKATRQQQGQLTTRQRRARLSEDSTILTTSGAGTWRRRGRWSEWSTWTCVPRGAMGARRMVARRCAAASSGKGGSPSAIRGSLCGNCSGPRLSTWRSRRCGSRCAVANGPHAGASSGSAAARNGVHAASGSSRRRRLCVSCGRLRWPWPTVRSSSCPWTARRPLHARLA